MTDDKASPLDAADRVEHDDGSQTYTLAHPAGPIVLKLRYDANCYSPLDPQSGDGLPALAMIENSYGRTDYAGTVDNVPYDMELDYPYCEGAGEIAVSDEDVTDADEATITEEECVHCVGSGRIEADDVEQYLKVTRNAVASLEITVGGRDQAPAVIYLVDEGEDGWTDPAAVLKSFASEYRRWEEGDCWGYVCTGPGSDDSCWGFIGREVALEEAESAFSYAVEAADKELAEMCYWEACDVVTMDAR